MIKVHLLINRSFLLATYVKGVTPSKTRARVASETECQWRIRLQVGIRFTAFTKAKPRSSIMRTESVQLGCNFLVVNAIGTRPWMMLLVYTALWEWGLTELH